MHLDGPVPARILRAAQFHEFVAELIEWTRQGDVAYVPEMRTQLVAARSVAEAVADLLDRAETAPVGNPVAEVAGPREEKLIDVARLLAPRTGTASGSKPGSGPTTRRPLPRGALLPGPVAKLAGPSFEEWLNR